MNIKKRHITSCFPPSQGGLGWVFSCLFLMFFLMSSCQEDDSLYDTTEVMMTFTTRALVSDIISSDAPDEDKMKDLRVIMLRENGTVVDNHIEKGINASSVTFTFTTPIQTGGEDFTFLAVANEGSVPTELSWLNCNPGDDLTSSLSAIKAQQIGNGSAFTLSDGQAIPQTKQWTVKVPQKDTYVENQQLDFVASKISVKFKNHTANEQSLSDIRITGIKPNGKGYLFEQANNDYVAEDVNLAQIDFSNVNVASGDSVIQSYYTYPVDGENFSSPTLYATWNEEKTMPLKIGENYISSLLRGQHLQIVVTLTGQGMIYHIADWVEEPTHIGSPSVNGGYDTEDWIADSDIVIGGGEEPDTPVVPGDVIWSKTLDPSYTLNYGAPESVVLTDKELSNFISGRFLGVVYTCTGDNGVLCVQRITNDGGWDTAVRNLPSRPDRINVSSAETYYEFELAADDVTAIKTGGGLAFWGGGISITKIYIKAPEN